MLVIILTLRNPVSYDAPHLRPSDLHGMCWLHQSELAFNIFNLIKYDKTLLTSVFHRYKNSCSQVTNFPKFLRDIQLKGRSDLTKMEERIIDTIPDTLEEFFDKNPEEYKRTKDCWSSLRSYFSDCWHQSRLHQHSSHSSQERRSPVLNTKETSHQWYQRKSKGESLFHLFTIIRVKYFRWQLSGLMRPRRVISWSWDTQSLASRLWVISTISPAGSLETVPRTRRVCRQWSMK